MTNRIAVQLRVMGRVQGVAFRHWARGQARALGVEGWVRNNPDGSVAALVIGTEEAVEKMVDRIWQGSGAAAVRDVSAQMLVPVPEISGFEITG